LNYVPL